ncbi:MULTISPECIES: hypothetical protein [Caulobacter]|jgi:hypothetical protein|uniref:Uncharacterized protein n=1 Tax=Caulobacter rhizosphaerae TaxID=2010972 RepID=A0ABU1MX55_9CAUL|nr:MULTISPECIES: hypothetical protein [Caulobacter]MDR6530632.1 hypothetical protein [Caulobacter rhizosphaerae]
MGQVVRGAPYRARQNGRSNRFGWFMLVVAVNLVLWTGVIALIVRAT